MPEDPNKNVFVQSVLSKQQVKELKKKTHETSVFGAIQKAVDEYLKIP